MMKPSNPLHLATRLSALGLLLSGAACVIEERLYDRELEPPTTTETESLNEGEPPEPEDKKATPEACEIYCDALGQKCDTEPPFAAANCHDTCLRSLAGDVNADNPTGDNIACRTAKVSTDFNSEEKDLYCQAAVPGGTRAGTVSCGSNCEAYCNLRAEVCDDLDLPAYGRVPCLDQCNLLPDLEIMDPDSQQIGADSIQCRITHLRNAAQGSAQAEAHCWHTRLNPLDFSGAVPDGAWPPCTDPRDQSPTCRDFCELTMGTCQGPNQVYTDMAECEAVCRALPPGQTQDTGGNDSPGNSVGCRRYHAYNALANPEAHCTHAGPTGNGHCTGSNGDNCISYCLLASTGCPERFSDAFPADANDPTFATCVASCQELPHAGREGFLGGDGVAPYNTNSPQQGNSVMCRTYHAVQALSAVNDAGQCASAFGEGVCE